MSENNYNFEEIEEPSVLSEDPNERKLARRLRIQKRLEALQKLDEDEEEKVEESYTEKQILASAELLEKLIAEGDEVITNVRIANDAREVDRRREAGKIRDNLLARIDDNAYECKEQYENINFKWSSIFDSNDPLHIAKEMEMQKEKCDEVIGIKDGLIAELREELRKAEDKFYEDQRKQKDDLKLLIERIENQMATMESVYGRELEMIEKTLKTERNTLIENFRTKLEGLYKQQEDEDIAGDAKRNSVLEEYDEEMDRVMTEHDEEYRAQKILLEKECQNMQLQLEKTKAICLLNAEKLSYNYKVLKSREEENSIVKVQQKRKITKLQGIINDLKKNYSDLKENTKLEIEKLTRQILKYHKSILEIEEKSNHFTRINEKQYLDIWNMNTQNANQLVKKILEADKTIHENTLGILYDPPDKPLPKKEDLSSYCTAIDIIKKRKEEEAERLKIVDHEDAEKSPADIKFERQLLNNILTQISNCSGYMIEEKLQELISSHSEEEKTIIRLDNVFQALSISTPEEINMLLDFFLPYTYCPTCAGKEDTIISTPCESEQPMPCQEICCGCLDKNVKDLIDVVKTEIGRCPCSRFQKCVAPSPDSEFSEDNEDLTKESRKIKTDHKIQFNKFLCDQGHVLEIRSAHVTKALKEFITKCRAADEKQMLSFEERLKEKKFTISRNISVEDVKYYWSSYREIFGVQKEKLWDAILLGLNKYFEVLKERHRLCVETESLKQQNIELQQLLKTHSPTPHEDISLLQVKSAYK